MPSDYEQVKAAVDHERADAMVAHRWFARHFGEIMNGRDFSVKCEMADREMERMRQREERLVEVLTAVQWANMEKPDVADGTVYYLCPFCDQSELRGHSPDCRIGMALGTAPVADTPEV